MLNKETYFTDESFVHSSQIKDYLENPYLYKKRHIDKDENFQFKVSDAVKKGTAVDEILTEGKTLEDFKLTPALTRDVKIFTEQIPEHPIWQHLKEKAEFQKIFEGEINGVKMCGKGDAVADAIFDLKITTEASAKNAQKWLWHCNDLKYNIAGAIYQELEGGKKDFYHLPAYIKNGIVYIKIYKMPQEMLDAGMKEVIRATEGIKAKKFDRDLCDMNSVEIIPWITPESIVAEDDDEF